MYFECLFGVEHAGPAYVKITICYKSILKNKFSEFYMPTFHNMKALN